MNTFLMGIAPSYLLRGMNMVKGWLNTYMYIDIINIHCCMNRYHTALTSIFALYFDM